MLPSTGITPILRSGTTALHPNHQIVEDSATTGTLCRLNNSYFQVVASIGQRMSEVGRNFKNRRNGTRQRLQGERGTR